MEGGGRGVEEVDEVDGDGIDGRRHLLAWSAAAAALLLPETFDWESRLLCSSPSPLPGASVLLRAA